MLWGVKGWGCGGHGGVRVHPVPAMGEWLALGERVWGLYVSSCVRVSSCACARMSGCVCVCVWVCAVGLLEGTGICGCIL